MALTSAQKFSIRKYLGWSQRFFQTDSALEMALSAIDNDVDASADVLANVVECVRLDTAIVAAERRLKAASVGPIDLNASEIEQLRDRGRQMVGRIASVLGVEVRNDVFSSDLPSSRATSLGMVGGGNRQLIG
jgi:hypothetical protein